jgi:hypothetical protein
MPTQPLDAVGDGRNRDGTFAKGNRAGRGNPLAKKAQQLRATMFRAVTTADLREIVKKLVDLAKCGDVAAAREVLQRCLGPAESVDILERLNKLEAALQVTAGNDEQV